MSKRIVVSASTHAMVSANSPTGFVYPVQRTSDGRFVVDLDDDIVAALARIDPDPETAIRIVCLGQMGTA